MDAQTALLQRRTIHKYQSAPVPEPVVLDAIRAAHQAPNHKLTYPWKFYQVGVTSREKLLQIVCELKNVEPGSEKAKAVQGKILNPGVLMIVTCRREKEPFRAREDYAAVACAIENFMVSLWANGFGSKWSTGAMTRDPRTYEVLGIEESEEEIVGLVSGGIPTEIPPEIKRPPMNEHFVTLP